MAASGRSMRMRGVAAAVILMFFGTSGLASAHHRKHSAQGTPGDFAYYLLSLSWSPAFCLSSPGSPECNGPRRYGFIVHGLWPQDETGWPEYCDVHLAVPDDVVQSIAGLMPARSLVYHEWSAHGTCSGAQPAEYFALVRRAYESVVIPSELSNPSRAIEESPGAIRDAFLRADPRLQAQSVVVTCTGQDQPRLREIHICLQRNLEPRACSADALRGACKAPQVIIPPIH